MTSVIYRALGPYVVAVLVRCMKRSRRQEVYARDPNQRSLESLLDIPESKSTVSILKASARPQVPGTVAFVDLFCGIGGFSEGCRQTGQSVVLAVDSCFEVLSSHRANHPSATHVCMTLGPDTEERLVKLIDAASRGFERVHIHGSPPCQDLSVAGAPSGLQDKGHGLALVQWFLDFVKRTRPVSWSFEQVPAKAVKAALSEFKESYPTVCDFTLVKTELLGIPQRRHRMVAGLPNTVQALRSSVLPEGGSLTPMTAVVSPPKGAAYMLASWGRLPDPQQTITHPDGTVHNPTIYSGCMVSIDRPHPTVMHKPGFWCDAKFRSIRGSTVQDALLWQTFPATYKTPRSRFDGHTSVGNAFPPAVARIVCAAVACMHSPSRAT